MDKEALAKAAGAALASGALGRNLLCFCLITCVIVLLLLCCFVLDASGAAFASAGALGKTCYVRVLLLCCCDILLLLFWTVFEALAKSAGATLSSTALGRNFLSDPGIPGVRSMGPGVCH